MAPIERDKRTPLSKKDLLIIGLSLRAAFDRVEALQKSGLTYEDAQRQTTVEAIFGATQEMPLWPIVEALRTGRLSKFSNN